MTSRANPDVLVIARESRNASQSAVAAAASVSQGMISKAENGLIDLNSDQVSAIATFLEYPTALFYEPGRARAVGSACLYHRKRKTLPAKVLTSLNARMELRLIGVRRLLRDLELETERHFHTMDPDEYAGSPAAVAQALRQAWRVPDGPIANLTTLIESAGGVVLKADFGTNKLMGMSCWERDALPLFYLNSRMAPEDLRWTIAHELGHLTMHGVPPLGDPEKEADEFAAEFLAPAAQITPALRRLAFDRLFPLKATWRLSIKALIFRAEAVGAIDRQTAVRLYKQYSARGYNAGEPYPLPVEPTTLVESAIRIHLDEHGYSPEELAAGVGFLKPHEFNSEFSPITPRSGNVVPMFGRPGEAR